MPREISDGDDLQKNENEQLRQRVRELSGENLHQEGFLIEDSTVEEVLPAPPKPKKKRKPQKGHGPTEQRSLKHVEHVYLLDKADEICPSCGGELKVWEDQFEGAELVDVIEKIYIVKKIKRQKYRCNGKSCDHIETALGPSKPISGGRYSLNFAVEIATEKYINHMPLERQARSMKRLGLKLRSQTLWDQIERLGKYLAPSDEALHAHILGKTIVGIDTTGWPKLMKKKTGTKPWQMWSHAFDGKNA